jgi:prolyl oligopeptidase
VHDPASRTLRRRVARRRRAGHAALREVHHRLGLEERLRQVENKAEFNALLKYSPYHNLKPGTRYPATLVLTADHDDRVVPAHSFKFASRLQECQAKDGPPTLIRIETSAGHGAGTALSKMIEKVADEWAFLATD